MFALPPKTSATPVKKPFPVWKWAAGAGLVVMIVLLSAILLLALQFGNKPAAHSNVTSIDGAAKGPTTGAPDRKELSPEDVRALQDMMADGKGWRQGLPSPLPPVRFQAEPPLRDAPPPVLLSEAEAYATANPTNYRSIIAKYQQIARNFSSLPAGVKARAAVDEWTKKRNIAADKVIAETDAKVRETIASGRHQEGIELWRDFPDELRAKEVDDKVDKLLDTYPAPMDDGMRGKGKQRPARGPEQ
jgi:hypothetical protein